jgi:hypothetical protein
MSPHRAGDPHLADLDRSAIFLSGSVKLLGQFRMAGNSSWAFLWERSQPNNYVNCSRTRRVGWLCWIDCATGSGAYLRRAFRSRSLRRSEIENRQEVRLGSLPQAYLAAIGHSTEVKQAGSKQELQNSQTLVIQRAN